MQLTEQSAYDVIAVTGSLPLYDERFQQALRIGGRLFVVVGQAPVMEAWQVTRVGEREWQRVEPVRDRDRAAGECAAAVGIRVLNRDLRS